MTAHIVFWPVIILALATLALYIPMSNARVKAVKSGVAKAERFKLNQNEPEASAQYVNAITNQYETPVLFYAVVICAFITGNATWIFIALAWLYTIAKIIHIYVHVTSNSLRLRRPVFMVAFGTLIVLWLNFAFNMLFGS